LVNEGAEDTAMSDVSISISDGVDLASIVPSGNMYVLHANNKNKLGKLTLAATYNNKVYTKTVEIIPLW